MSLSLAGEVPNNDMSMEFQQDGIGLSGDVSPVDLEDQEGEIRLDINRTTGDEDLTTNCKQNDLLRVHSPTPGLTAKSFIKIHYHPRTGLPAKVVDPSKDTPIPMPPLPNLSPFAPFPSEADFRIAERVINDSASTETINFILNTHHDSCFINENGSKVCFKTARQLYKCVDDYANIHEGVRASQFA